VVPPSGVLKGVIFSITEIWQSRDLLKLLVARDLKSKYKDSSLGVLWSFGRPLVQLAIFYVAIGKFLGAERSIPEFAIFVFTGLTAWLLISETLTVTTTSIVSNAGLIKKVFLPREIFPIAAVGASVFSFLIQFFVLVIAVVVLGQFPLNANLLFLPVSIFMLLIYGAAFGLLFSALNVYFRDVQHFVEVGLLVLFWASPIVYSFDLVKSFIGQSYLLEVYLLNPITVGILGFQKAMWLAGSDSAWPEDLMFRLIIMSFVGIIFLWFSQVVFSKLQGNFAQEI
jgi:ABC-2 type transport system permease protein